MRVLPRLITGLALCGLGLNATDFSGGIGLGPALPIGALKSDALFGTQTSRGGSWELHFEWQVRSRDALRLRAVDTSFQGEQRPYPNPGPLTSISSEWNALGWGLDWRHDFRTPQQGWFSLAGLGLARVERNTAVWFPLPGVGQVGSSHITTQNSRPSLRVGGGYHFNRFFSLESCLHQVSVEKDGVEGLGVSAISWVEIRLAVSFGKGR